MPQGFGFEKKRARIQLPADGWLIWGRDRPHCQVGMTATCRRPSQWSLFDPSAPLTFVAPGWWRWRRRTFIKIHVPVLVRDAGPGPRGLKGAGVCGQNCS